MNLIVQTIALYLFLGGVLTFFGTVSLKTHPREFGDKGTYYAVLVLLVLTWLPSMVFMLGYNKAWFQIIGFLASVTLFFWIMLFSPATQLFKAIVLGMIVAFMGGILVKAYWVDRKS